MRAKLFCVFKQTHNLERRIRIIKVHLPPPPLMTEAAVDSKAAVLLSLIHCLSLLPLFVKVLFSVSSLCNFGANKFYDRAHRIYDAIILTRCYNQHALRPYTD